METVGELEQRVESLSTQVEQAKQTSRQLQETHAGKLQALERENDLLREQLKKYVSMVQTQWKGSPSKQPSSGKTGYHSNSSVQVVCGIVIIET